jgi:hypothetical protein
LELLIKFDLESLKCRDHLGEYAQREGTIDLPEVLLKTCQLIVAERLRTFMSSSAAYVRSHDTMDVRVPDNEIHPCSQQTLVKVPVDGQAFPATQKILKFALEVPAWKESRL